MIYLDNNATTYMPKEVIDAMVTWTNKGNPSSGNINGATSRSMMYNFRKYIATCCSFKLAEDFVIPRDDYYRIIFTSCASESNSTILTSVIDAYAETHKVIPNVIISAYEHKSIIALVNDAESRGKITATMISPQPSGLINPADIEAAITPHTCIISIMHANNEIGVINDIAAIGKIAHTHRIPFHTDTVQTFGKYNIDPIKMNIDAFSVSFHKIHGPPGVGALIIKEKLLCGYRLHPIIYGAQNYGLRGGTENLPGIGASFSAMRYNQKDRSDRNMRILQLREMLVGMLRSEFPCRYYTEYLTGPAMPYEIVFLTGEGSKYMFNTLLLSVVKRTKPMICNVKMRKELESMGVIVSIGSACNTQSKKASHVLYSLGADEYIRAGALRVSIGDENTVDDIREFFTIFSALLRNNLKKIKH